MLGANNNISKWVENNVFWFCLAVYTFYQGNHNVVKFNKSTDRPFLRNWL